MFHRTEKNLYRIIAPLIILLLVFLAAVACQKDILFKRNASRSIGCIVDFAGTKANSGPSETHGDLVSTRTIKGDSGLDLIESVYENDFLPPLEETKGKQITSEGASSSISIRDGGFVMKAYAEDKWHDNELADGVAGSITNPHDAGDYFSANVTYSGSNWSIYGDPKWLNGVPLTFWCWDTASNSKIASTVSYTAGQSPLDNLTFDYSLPIPATASPYQDAENQSDMVIAFNSETRAFNDEGNIKSGESSGSRSDDKIDIHFFHALSAIQFFTGNIPSGYRISRISLKNVASSATITVTGGGKITDPGKSGMSLSFAYSSYGSNATYTQDYGLSDTSIADRSSETTRNHPGDEKTFFMIPQTLGTDAALEVTITNTSDATDYKVHSFSLNGSSWEAGKYYVYKINAAGEVSVDIGEQCNPTVKSNVNFTNTNNVSEYFRAMIVANWYDNDGNIVAPWDSSQGMFVGLPGTGWSQESDGYYYLSSPVEAEATSANLFDSYTKPSTPPVEGAHLEMTILVQAVAYKEGVACTAAFTN